MQKINKFYDIKPEEAVTLVRKWGDIKINGKTLRESLTYNNLSFWDIIEYNFVSLIFEQHYQRKGYIEPYLRRYLNNLKQYQRRLTAKKYGFNLDKNKILIFPPIETTIPLITPVIKELQKDPKNDIMVLRLGTLRERMRRGLKKQQVKNTPLEAYLTRDVIKRTKKIEKKIDKVWKQIKDNKKFQNSIKYNSVCVWDLVKDSFSYYFSTRKRITEVITYIEIMRNILNTEKPDIVVMVDECSEIAKPTAILAKLNNITSLSIQHGLYAKHNFIFGPVLFDKIAVWGEATKSLIVNRGVNSKKIVITGCPKFDSLPKFQADKVKTLNKLGLDLNKETILFAAPAIFREETKKVFCELLKIIKKSQNKQLILKLHPRDYSVPYYQKIVDKFNVSNVAITREFNLYELINSSDIVFILSSTTGLEALMMNKPLIMFDVLKKPNIFTESKTTLKIDNYNEIENTIITFLKNQKLKNKLNKNRDKFISDQVYKLDGKSTERIVNLILKMSKK